jgi:PPOX class probable F420-dependent enzyme
MNIIPQDRQDLLSPEKKSFANIATIGPRGEPQNNPVWFDYRDGKIRFSQTTARQKLRNLKRDPRVAISIIDPENPYRYLELRGKVVNVRPDRDRAFGNHLAMKYTGGPMQSEDPPGVERVIVEVEPEHATTMR